MRRRDGAPHLRPGARLAGPFARTRRRPRRRAVSGGLADERPRLALREARRAGHADGRDRPDSRSCACWPNRAPLEGTPSVDRGETVGDSLGGRGLRHGVFDALLHDLPDAAALLAIYFAKHVAAGRRCSDDLRRGGRRRRPSCSSRCLRSCSSSRAPPGRTSSPTVRSSSTAPSPPVTARSRARRPMRGCCGAKGSAGHPPAPPSPASSARRIRDRDRWRPALVLIAFPIAFLAVHQQHRRRRARYLNPALPAIAAFAALRRQPDPALRPRLACAGSAPVITAGAVRPQPELGLFFQQTDTRTLAQRLIEQQLPAGATVLVQPYSVSSTSRARASSRPCTPTSATRPRPRPSSRCAWRSIPTPPPPTGPSSWATAGWMSTRSISATAVIRSGASGRPSPPFARRACSMWC